MKRLITAMFIIMAMFIPSVAHAQLGSVPTTFSAGSVIRSADVNAMFSAIYANAANRTAPVMTGAMTTVSIFPTADNTSDLGSAALSYRNAWIEGTLTVGSLAASGTLNLTNKLTITLTTAQLRLAYDGSNYVDVTVSSVGLVTFDATGSGAGYNFVEGLRERNRTVAMGEWANQAFAAGEYTASASSWTVDSGDVALNRYMLVGKTVTWQITVASTDVGGTPAHLRIAVPGSLTEVAALSRGGACGLVTDAGVSANQSAYWIMDASGYVKLFLHTGGNWSTTAADNTGVTCTIIFEIA